MDVLQDSNKLCSVEDIELNGLKTSIEHIPKYSLNIYILHLMLF